MAEREPLWYSYTIRTPIEYRYIRYTTEHHPGAVTVPVTPRFGFEASTPRYTLVVRTRSRAVRVSSGVDHQIEPRTCRTHQTYFSDVFRTAGITRTR